MALEREIKKALADNEYLKDKEEAVNILHSNIELQMAGFAKDSEKFEIAAKELIRRVDH